MFGITERPRNSRYAPIALDLQIEKIRKCSADSTKSVGSGVMTALNLEIEVTALFGELKILPKFLSFS